MCYICNCFAWTLDLIQRIITFALACLMACAVCFGLLVAIGAGIAYGYNYSLAEFLTFTRSDVTVYMRRGQFLDKPDLFSPSRRSGDNKDQISVNMTGDSQSRRSGGGRSLSDAWNAAEDSRRYAEKLTKYSAQNSYDTEIDAPNSAYGRISLSPVASQIPIFGIPTAVWRRGSSKIIMRNFPPVEEITSAIKSLKDFDYVNFDKNETVLDDTKNMSENIVLHNLTENNDVLSGNLTSLHSGSITTYKPPPVLDYPNDIEEEITIYNPA